jgi:hypothetical protein
VYAERGWTLARAATRLIMLAALLLAAAAVVCAGLAVLYARIFHGGLRERHAAHAENMRLFGNSATILALNDADVYASWRLVRVNVCVAAVCLIIASALFIGRRALL